MAIGECDRCKKEDVPVYEYSMDGGYVELCASCKIEVQNLEDEYDAVKDVYIP